MSFDLDKVDFDNLGSVEETPLVPDPSARMTMDEAFKVNPDQHARNTQLSRDSGVPEFAVNSDPDAVERNLKVDNIDFGSLQKKSPVTSNHLSDFNRAVVSQDDIDVMQKLEETVAWFKKPFEGIGESIDIGFDIQRRGGLAAGIESGPKSISDLIPMSAMPIGMEAEAFNLSEQFAERAGIESDEQLQQLQTEAVEGLITDISDLKDRRQDITPEDLDTFQQGIRAGVESIALNAPGVVAALATGGRAAPALAAMYVQTGGASYGEARAEGLSHDAAMWKANIDAGIEVGTEILPTGTLERMITGQSKGLTKDALKFMVQEMGTEQLATLLQTVNDYGFGLDEQLEQAESVDEMISIQLQRQAVTAVATLVHGGTQATAVSTINKAMAAVTKKDQEQQTQFEKEQNTIDRLDASASESTTRQRDSEMFRQFIKEVDEQGETAVYIDGVAAREYMSNMTGQQIAEDPALQFIADQVAEASTLGGDIVIPVADFATDFAGTDHFAALRQDMKMSADSVTPNQVDEQNAAVEDFRTKLIAEAEERSSEYVEAQNIATSVIDQLVDTGRMNAQDARTSTEMVSAYVAVKARQEGIGVQQAWDKYGFTVEGPLTGEKARLQAEEALLSQEDPAYTNAPDLFDQARDKFLTVLDKDASSEDVRDAIEAGEFSREYANLLNSLERDGYLGFDFPSQAVDAVLTEEQSNFDLSQGTKVALARLINSENQVFAQDRPDAATDTAEFEAWSGGGEIIESEDINDHRFQENTPVVLKVHHGTTHEFSVFDALRGNLEGQFGAINYFTSSEHDADVNYAGEGPDLTNRIEQRAEQIQQELDELGEFARDDFKNITDEELEGLSEYEADVQEEVARRLATEELSGGQDQVMELYVKVENPFVIGEDSQWVEFVDNDEVLQEAKEQVADDNGIELSELEENIDDYEDQIDDIRWEIESERDHPLVEAIQTVASRYEVDATTLAGEVYELGPEATHQQIEELIRGNEEISYAEDPETGTSVQSQMIAEIIEEMGYDSIILKDAEQRFSNMEMEPGTTHVHIFDSNKTNIKSVQNIGAFDPTDPDIFKQEARGYYDPTNSIIRLTEASDLSTFIHEFAHFMYETELNSQSPMIESINGWYKRNAESVAEEAEGDISVKDVNAFLDNTTTGNKSKDESIRRAVHEQFARGFETYIMEGKAPSVELRNAFRRMARWLVEVYRTITLQKPNLDAEMREVFDRLLATEEQIEIAKARQQFEPLFNDAAMAGMTPKEFEAYQERKEKVTDKANETLRDKMVKEITRQTEKWWKEEKSDIVDEQINELKDQQVYRAREVLKSGEVRLDTATVKEMHGEERTFKRGGKTVTQIHVPEALKGMTAKGKKGVHPDEAAAFFGYNSGDEMIQDLMTAPSLEEVADANAEAVMKERHGDMMNDGSIERLADEALQNEERGKLILSELKALSRGTNQPAIERKAIQDLARENIGKLSYRQINPGKYRRAEIKAAREAERMLAEGNREGAAAAKARQVMNYYLGMEAQKARDESMKILDRMKRYNKKSVREEIIKAENGYWEQIEKILSRFEFRKSVSMKQVDQVNESIQTWAEKRMNEDGDALVLSNAVLNEFYVTHWKNVPFAELTGINDSVRNIEHVARYGNKIRLMEEEIDFKKLVENWTTSMDEKVDTKFKSQRTDVAEGRNWGRWAVAQMTKIPYMASWLDGGERVGMSHDILVQPLTDAYHAKLKMWDEIGVKVIDALENRDKADLKRHNTKLFIPEIKDANNDGHLMGHQVLAVALNTGNQSNLKKMLLGEGWANPEFEEEIDFNNPKLQAVLKHMTKKDWELVQLIWDEMDKLYPQLAEVHRRTTGLVPPKVEATPLQVNTDGEQIDLGGGYYPVKYDPNRDIRAQENEDKLNAETESMFNNTASIQASVTAGATNERTGYYAPIRLSLDVVPNHFDETIHYITHHDAVRQINKLIRNKSVANKITEKLGKEEYAQLKPWLNDVAKDGREAPTKMFWDSMLQRLRFGVTLGVMGFKASTGIIQISGLSNSIAELGMGPVMQSMRSILGSPQTMKGAWEFARDNSKVLEHRTKTMDREIKNAMKRLEGKRGVLAAAQEASMKHIALIQTYMVDLPTWHAAYIKEMQEHGDEQRAYRRADWTIENIQGSGVTKDMARIVRGQSEAGRMFTMFMTFFSSLWNMERDLVKGAKSGLYSTSNVAAKGMFLFAIPVLFEMMMRGELGEPEDEDDRLQQILTKTALYPIQSVPFVRDIASGVTGEFGYNISPIAQLLESGTQSIPEVVVRGFTDEEITKGQAKGASKFIGAAVGVPGVNQAWATGEHLYDVMVEGEELTTHQLLFGPKRD